MKKVMFKFLTILVLLTFVLSACSAKDTTGGKDPAKEKPSESFNATGFPIVNEQITFKMFADRSAANGPYKDMAMFQAYEKMTNIKMDFNDVDDASFGEKKSLVFGSNSLPDIFFKAGITPLEAIKYGSSGVLIPLEGLIEKYAPNLQSIFTQYPEVKQALTAPDGHIYALSDVVTLVSARTNKLWLNKSMISGVNMKEPTTTDELYQVLKAFKSKYPDNTPMATSSTQDLINALGGAFGLGPQMGYNIKIDNDKVHIWTASNEYKELLMYLNQLYKEDLIDHQILTQTFAQYIAKMQSAKVGLFTNQATDAFPMVADQYTGIAPFKGPNGDQMYPAGPVSRTYGVFAISSTNKNPAAAIRWVDYFYGEEGSVFFRYGVEGETFNYSADGIPTYTDSVMNAPKGVGSITPWPGGGAPQWINEKNATAINPPQVQEAADKLQPYLPKQIFSAPLFDANVSRQVNDLKTDIDTFVGEATAKFITGDRKFDTWDEYVSQLEQMGLKDLEKFYQEAYDKQYK